MYYTNILYTFLALHLGMEKLKAWYPPWLGRLVGAGGGTVKLSMAVVISWMLDLFLSFLPEVWRRKYFWAWLATWVGVLVTTTFLDMLLQSPFPYRSSPIKNNLQKFEVYNQQICWFQTHRYTQFPLPFKKTMMPNTRTQSVIANSSWNARQWIEILPKCYLVLHSPTVVLPHKHILQRFLNRKHTNTTLEPPKNFITRIFL